jgi:hypothetical protein
MRTVREKWITFLLAASLPLTAIAGYLKVWSPGELFNVSDLNGNFAHIHSTMVGGHGPRLRDADVASNANIAASKLANAAIYPKGYYAVTSQCTVSPCSFSSYGGPPITSVTRSGTGLYTLTWATPRPNALYNVFFSGSGVGATYHCMIQSAVTTTTVSILCTGPSGTALDAAFGFLLFDDNP